MTSNSSVYSALPTASEEYIEKAIRNLKAAFRTMADNTESNAAFWIMLANAIRRNGISEPRLHRAVTHLIDTCKYPTFQIADIVEYDKSLKEIAIPMATAEALPIGHEPLVKLFYDKSKFFICYAKDATDLGLPTEPYETERDKAERKRNEWQKPSEAEQKEIDKVRMEIEQKLANISKTLFKRY